LQKRISDFDFDLLLAFDALLKDQNVTHAAARLNITQSALSARLSRLRLLLNDPLFVTSTSGRGMVPTPHASELAPELARLVEHLNDFVNTAHLFDPATSKRVFRIAATDNPSAILAPDLIPLIKSQAPFTKIAFTLPDKAKIAEHLEHGELDLFIGQRRGHPRGTGSMAIDEFCELDHLLISTSGGRFSGMIDDALAEIGRERRVSVSMQNYGLAPLVLTSTDCICTLPYRFLKRFEHVLDFVKPPLELAHFDMHLFWHPRSRKDPAHIWLRKQVMQVAQGNKE
jgi:DNA-binding transcriptional LysR family regulator